MRPRMLVATRFGLKVRDAAWFEHRLVLFSAVTVPSMLAQNDEGFEWAVFVDDGIPKKIRYELNQQLSQLRGRAFICERGHSARVLMELATERNLIDDSGYLLSGRIDDDDAWDKETVRLVRDHAGAWQDKRNRHRGLGLTFENGLVWQMYDTYDVDQLQRRGKRIVRPAAIRPYRYPFTSISGFVYSPCRNPITSISASHSRVPMLMQEGGFEIEHLRASRPMWLYCRHKQTTSPIHRAGKAKELHWSVADLAVQFGIDKKLTQQYIERSEEYGYSRVLRHFELRGHALRELRKVSYELRGADLCQERGVELRRRKAELEGELKRLSDSLVVRSIGEVNCD